CSFVKASNLNLKKSGCIRSSLSNQFTNSPVLLAKPKFLQAFAPLLSISGRLKNFIWEFFSQYNSISSSVQSPEPSSTTIHSQKGYDWEIIESSVAPKISDRLQVGIMTETNGRSLILSFHII